MVASPLKTNRAPKLTKAEDWPWFEQAFIDFLRCYTDYWKELIMPLDPNKQMHIAGALTQCVEDPMARRELVHMRRSSGANSNQGYLAWRMLKDMYSGNTTTRQSELHDKMTDSQKKSENIEAYLDRVMAAALDLGEIGAPVTDVGLKNLIFKGLLRDYVPYVTQIHLRRNNLTLDQYRASLLEAGRIYEHTLQRKTEEDGSAAFMGNVPVPDPFGYQ